MKKLSGIVILIPVLIILFQAESCDDDKYYGCSCENDKTLTKSFSISTDSPTGTLSVYNETGGEFEADGGCHAVMKFRFRWADDERAKTDERPPVSYEFGTPTGYFPAGESMEEITTDGAGIHTWEITVNEAENKNYPNETSYGFKATYQAGSTIEGSIQCYGSIVYLLYNSLAYTEGCEN